MEPMPKAILSLLRSQALPAHLQLSRGMPRILLAWCGNVVSIQPVNVELDAAQWTGGFRGFELQSVMSFHAARMQSQAAQRKTHAYHCPSDYLLMLPRPDAMA